MPDNTQWQVARKIKAHEGWPPVVVLQQHKTYSNRPRPYVGAIIIIIIIIEYATHAVQTYYSIHIK